MGADEVSEVVSVGTPLVDGDGSVTGSVLVAGAVDVEFTGAFVVGPGGVTPEGMGWVTVDVAVGSTPTGTTGAGAVTEGEGVVLAAELGPPSPQPMNATVTLLTNQGDNQAAVDLLRRIWGAYPTD